MMTYKSKISSALLPALVACSAASLSGCADQGPEQVGSSDEQREVGDLSLALGVAPGVTLNSIRYQVSGNGFLRSRTVDVGSTSQFSLFVGAIPAGNGYTITLEAGGVGQAVSCMGSATFNVTAGQTSMVTVNLSCQVNEGTGGVIVDANTNLCPVLEDLEVSTKADVGGTIPLSAAASDLDSAPQPVSYSWNTTLGTLANGSSSAASILCTAPGEGTVTLTYTDGRCSQTMQVPVRCLEGAEETDGGTQEPDAGAEPGVIRITEWMYDGAGGEWVELTNVGGAPVDLTGWSYDDDSATVGVFSLSGFGVVQPGESVVFTESTADSFRTSWGLCAGVKVLGGYTNNLGRADQINIFDAAGALVDRLNYGDQAIPGSIRTTGASGWVSAAGLGANDALAWTLSTVGDAEGSAANTGNAIGSPGKSTRATVAFAPCAPVEPEPWSFEAWPGSADVTTVDATATFTGDVSGLTYQPAGAGTPAYLWVVENGNGLLYRLELSGGQWLPSAGDWANGKNLRYTDGAGIPDSEGVTKTDWSSSAIYVATERNNSASGVSRPAVLRFDSDAAGTSLTATNEWNLVNLLPVVGANLGLEAISWIPDSFLVANGFFDESANALYAPATYGDHAGGLFFVGLEGNGRIYAVALNHTTGAATLVATIDSSFGGIMGMEFDRDTGSLWAVIDNTGNGRSTVLNIDTRVGSATRGRFVITAGYERPANLPNANNEGFALAPESECVGGVKAAWWGDDDDTDGFSVRQGSVSCGI